MQIKDWWASVAIDREAAIYIRNELLEHEMAMMGGKNQDTSEHFEEPALVRM